MHSNSTHTGCIKLICCSEMQEGVLVILHVLQSFAMCCKVLPCVTKSIIVFAVLAHSRGLIMADLSLSIDLFHIGFDIIYLLRRSWSVARWHQLLHHHEHCHWLDDGQRMLYHFGYESPYLTFKRFPTNPISRLSGFVFRLGSSAFHYNFYN